MPALYTQEIKISATTHALLRKKQFLLDVGMFILSIVIGAIGVIPLYILLNLDLYHEYDRLLILAYMTVFITVGMWLGSRAIKAEASVVRSHGGDPKRHYRFVVVDDWIIVHRQSPNLESLKGREMKESRSPKSEFIRGLTTGFVAAVTGPLLGLALWLMGETPDFAQKTAVVMSVEGFLFGFVLGIVGASCAWLCGKLLTKKAR
jgi:cytochrome c biogenesis protein CcdA